MLRADRRGASSRSAKQYPKRATGRRRKLGAEAGVRNAELKTRGLGEKRSTPRPDIPPRFEINVTGGPAFLPDASERNLHKWQQAE